MKLKSSASGYVLLAVLCCTGWGLCSNDTKTSDDWNNIWLLPMPTPTAVEIDELDDLGKDLKNQQWMMIATRYHQIHFTSSVDKTKLAEIYARIDNLYTFLAERSPENPPTPIKVFLVPGEIGHSRCSKINNAIRTGSDGDMLLMLTSLLHEETHIFNFAFLNDTQQGWWAGEFSCIYFQQRALWQGQHKQIKQQIQKLLPNGPLCHLAEISANGKDAFNEAFSFFYFIEEEYGREKFIELRKALLKESQETNGESLSDSVFEQVLGENERRLETQWLKFYGWKSLRATKETRPADTRLKTKISYSVDKASVQNIVREMAGKAGLKYDEGKSKSNADELCRRWARNIQINNKPLDEALKEILNPVGLTYRLEENSIVLYRK